MALGRPALKWGFSREGARGGGGAHATSLLCKMGNYRWQFGEQGWAVVAFAVTLSVGQYCFSMCRLKCALGFE